MVDAVNKVVHLGEDDIVAPPVFGAGIRAEFISGIGRHEDRSIIVLDLAKVFSINDMGLFVKVAPAQEEPAGSGV